MRGHRTPLAGVLLLLAMGHASSGQIPDGFEFVRVTNDDDYHNYPNIGSNSVVYSSLQRPWPTSGNIRVFSGGIVRHITNDLLLNLNPAISNLDKVAWIRGVAQGMPFDVVTNFLPGPIQAQYQASGPVDVNDDGDVVWDFALPSGDTGIALYDPNTGVIVSMGDPQLSNQGAQINNLGQVVWTTYDFDVSPWVGQIMMYSDGNIQELTTIVCQCQTPDINDAGTVVWRNGDLDSIVLWDGAETRVIIPKAAGPRINNSGNVSFGRTIEDLDANVHFLLKDGVEYQMPDLGLGAGSQAINDRDELAMRFIDFPGDQHHIYMLRRIAPQGDFNHDCRIDLYDHQIFENCYTGDGLGPADGLLADCTRADFDVDGDVDELDHAAFMGVADGPGLAVVGCAR